MARSGSYRQTMEPSKYINNMPQYVFGMFKNDEICYQFLNINLKKIKIDEKLPILALLSKI